MESLKTALARISALSPDTEAAFLSAWKSWTLPKDHPVLREHSVSDYIYFIEKGAARIFYTKNGKTITEWLALDQQFFLSITSFFQRSPSHLGIHTLEPAELRGIHYQDFMSLADRYHEVERLLRKMITDSLILSQVRMDAIQFETAQQRYDRLMATQPEIIQRVPLTYIASFLGMTLETLSRIRSGK